MVPPSSKVVARAVARKRYHNEHFLQKIYRKYCNFEFFKYVMFNPAALPVMTIFILLAESILNIVIIERVPYTEIDWKAYMQECEGFLNGTTNYALLKGDTGPLVYPAAFLYIYSALYFITSQGQNIRLAQYIFSLIYLLQMWLVLRLYGKARKVPPCVLLLTIFTSYRIHSIYVLRLFNDPIAILFLYAALNLFMDGHWTWGSLCFSLGVGCKMNILLFAPALFLFYLINLGLGKTILQLAVCGILQLLLGLPFLLTYPWEYIKGSFDFSRVFEHKWTVNYRFMPREYFENKYFHLALLGAHLILLVAFTKPTITYFNSYYGSRILQSYAQPQLDQQNKILKENKSIKGKAKPATKQEIEEKLTPEQKSLLEMLEKQLQKTTGFTKPPIKLKNKFDKTSTDDSVSIHFDTCNQLAILPFFLCNFIGVICARSLHYQFYVWYYHSLPYLTWTADLSVAMRLTVLGLIEYCWKVYPSTNLSSFTLHICHLVILYGVASHIFKSIHRSATVTQQTELNVSEEQSKAKRR